jgi:hypothetical protein
MPSARISAGGVEVTGFLTRERIVERPGWSRWLVLPPAALSIHLAIGQV